ncbi:coproporphyrinogen dehydrogenase HemZ [Novisyntrophococcus fermenticellae]|uniref:coproporphyrinogen dehydrogenase HemZ n=1 Tax=Novisyntrophococcus fermenticellae TaxID=2068655 RepID=UPI001E343864|nr:coproporphyrinogen dehydrogenase HemZ [Novisyntrophococcus fermenticellae]
MRLKLNKREFEYDIYSLIRAFYPGSEIKIWYEGEEEPDGNYIYDYLMEYSDDSITFAIMEGEHEVSRKTTRIPEAEEQKERKNHVKKLVYKSLVSQTKRELPWGNLTGIRPTKIPMHMLEEGKSNVEIARYMRDTYGTSPEKTALAITIANRERAILKEINYEEGYSLYVGIPFCPSICLYCSFGSHVLKTWSHMVEPYLDALKKELSFIAEQMKGRPLDTIYIGGGTPTTLEAGQMGALLEHICREFPVNGLKEFTVEAGRPDTITTAKLAVLKEFPVTRISINPQTMNQETLDLIGRKHTVEEITETFNTARDMGFDNINMDLIVGLPGEHKEQVAHTLEQMKIIDPDSLTIHSLALKRATRLNLFKEQYQEISFENSQEIMQMTENCSREMGMSPYYLYRQKNMAGNFENVGYAKLDKAGIYNILIMEEKQTIMAAGAGASSKFVFQHGERIERAENVKDLKSYVERIDEMLERKRIGVEKFL